MIQVLFRTDGVLESYARGGRRHWAVPVGVARYSVEFEGSENEEQGGLLLLLMAYR